MIFRVNSPTSMTLVESPPTPQEPSIPIPDDSAITQALESVGAVPKVTEKRSKFQTELNKIGGTTEFAAIQLVNLARNSDNDGTKLKAISMILAANDIQVDPEDVKPVTNVQIVLQSPDSDLAAMMLNPQDR